MKTKLRAIALGVGMTVVPIAVTAMPVAAHATCYTGCTTSASTTPTGNAGSGSSPSGATTTGSSSSLPFTGADIGEMVAVGAGAIALGAVMVRRNRRSNVLQS